MDDRLRLWRARLRLRMARGRQAWWGGLARSMWARVFSTVAVAWLFMAVPDPGLGVDESVWSKIPGAASYLVGCVLGVVAALGFKEIGVRYPERGCEISPPDGLEERVDALARQVELLEISMAAGAGAKPVGARGRL